ncbi:MAG: outer membrane lipoprotein carrier protein LolA [Treponema sp.]|jgi:hypothetical protein|nr:outer membrane lipoprotein carrier protein LolA [Treponema sp.]
MKKFFISNAVFLLIISALFAQNTREEIFRHPLGPQTRNAFNETCSALANHSYIKGTFEQVKTISRLERSLKSSGNFIIASDMGMVWETLKPFSSTMALGKNFIIQSRPGGQKTFLSAQGNETFLHMAEVISAVFSGNAKELLENFEVYYFMPDQSRGSWELGLIPQNKAIGVFAERIIMKGDSAIRSIFINEQSGDSIQYILMNHSYPPELNANEKAVFILP